MVAIETNWDKGTSSVLSNMSEDEVCECLSGFKYFSKSFILIFVKETLHSLFKTSASLTFVTLNGLSCNIRVLTVDTLSSSLFVSSFWSAIMSSLLMFSFPLLPIVAFEVPGLAGGGASRDALGVERNARLNNGVGVG